MWSSRSRSAIPCILSLMPFSCLLVSRIHLAIQELIQIKATLQDGKMIQIVLVESNIFSGNLLLVEAWIWRWIYQRRSIFDLSREM